MNYSEQACHAIAQEIAANMGVSLDLIESLLNWIEKTCKAHDYNLPWVINDLNPKLWGSDLEEMKTALAYAGFLCGNSSRHVEASEEFDKEMSTLVDDYFKFVGRDPRKK